MSEKFKIDGEAVRKLAEILNDTDLSEIEYEDKDRRVRVARHITQQAIIPAAAPVAASALPVAAPEPAKTVESVEDHPGAVKSPMVGTAYLSPEPGANNFVSPGDMVKEGQTVVIIEAMKVMNPIKAPRTGKVVDILVKDASPVEFGQVLLILES